MLKACDRAALRVLRSAPLIGKWAEASYVVWLPSHINNTDWAWLHAALLKNAVPGAVVYFKSVPFFRLKPACVEVTRAVTLSLFWNMNCWIFSFVTVNKKQYPCQFFFFKSCCLAHLIQMMSVVSAQSFGLNHSAFMTASLSSADFCEFIHHQHFFSFFFSWPLGPLSCRCKED